MTAYSTRHWRVREVRGPARNQTCVDHRDRGEPRPALDWALIHDHDGEDPFDYVAMCRSCHICYDGSGHRTPHSDATKATLSRKNRQYRHTPEAIEKIRQAGREHMTVEAREHLSAVAQQRRRRKGGDA